MATNAIRASAMHRSVRHPARRLLRGGAAGRRRRRRRERTGAGATHPDDRRQPVRGLHRRQRGLAGWRELSQHRDRALGRRQPAKLTQPDRGLAAGPLVQWRLAGAPRWRQLRRRRQWRTVRIPGTTACTGGSYKRASDPWVTIAPNGTAYLHEPVVRPGPAERRVRPQRDAGEPLHRRREFLERPDHADPGPRRAGPERQELDHRRRHQLQLRLRGLGPVAGLHAPTAGGRGAGRRHGRGAGRRGCRGRRGRGAPAGAAAAAAGRQRGGAAAAAAPVFFEGPVYLARTTNGGRSWQPARKIYDPGPNSQTINNLVVVPPSGTVFDFFTEISPNGGTRIGLIRSFDKGATWQRAALRGGDRDRVRRRDARHRGTGA